MVVVNVEALSNLVIKSFTFLPYSQEGNYWYGKGKTRTLAQCKVLFSYRVNNFVKVTVCIVRLAWDHFEHPRTVFEHQWKVEVFVLLRNVFFA
jgi:hypothetical protein